MGGEDGLHPCKEGQVWVVMERGHPRPCKEGQVWVVRMERVGQVWVGRMERVRLRPCNGGQVWVVLVCPPLVENGYMKLRMHLIVAVSKVSGLPFTKTLAL